MIVKRICKTLLLSALFLGDFSGLNSQTLQKRFDEKEFQNPSKNYRLLAFWSWNDKLEESQLREQIRYMDEGGWGGFFMHARGGLVTKYFSGDWFDCTKVCVDEAKKRGMEAWMYDENLWPSGTADYTISFKDKAYRETHLFVAKDKIPHNPEDVNIYKEDTLLNKNGVKETFYFYKWKAPLGQARWRGGSYVDLMNPDMTDQFIQFAHEKYKKELGDEFGKSIPGIFTDDITLIWDLYNVKTLAVPWTDKMPEHFKKIYGYNIENNTDKLFLNLAGYEKVRVDFYRTVNKLFAENYWKKLFDWCDQNNLKLAGHHMADGLPFNDLMQNFEYEQVPTLDLLSFKQGHLLTLRAITSIANQLDKERTMCEAFAATGHNLTFEGQKWLSDWLFVNGINTIAAHIYQYSMRAERKRDHPPAMSHQQPWWGKYNHIIADYQARCSYFITRGKRACDILLLYPTESFSLTYTPYARQDYNDLSEKFYNSINYLLDNQLDFDLGSEEIISKYGSVNNKVYKIGSANYSVVVLPPTKTIRQSTLTLLEDYINNGGIIFAIDKLPDYIDGIALDSRQKQILSKIKVIHQSQLVEKLSTVYEPTVKILTTDGKKVADISYSERIDNDKSLFLIVNKSRENGYNTEISLKGTGKLYELNLKTGEQKPLTYRTDNERTIFNYSISPVGSIALILDSRISDIIPKKEEKQTVVNSTIQLGIDGWKLKPQSVNSLTLDYCQYSEDGIIYSKPMYVLDVAQKLKKGENIQYLRYNFESTEKINGEASFVIETPQKFEIKINDHPIAWTTSETFLDFSFKKININGLIKKGKNVIDLKIKDKDDISVEATYVCGNFGIDYINKTSFRISQLKKNVNITDLTKEGLPFFVGSANIVKNVIVKKIISNEKFILKFDTLNAVVAEVFINDQNAGNIVWNPYTLDITPFLRAGKNIIRISLTNSLHNILGYHHNSQQQLDTFINPTIFNDKQYWSDEYFIKPFGLSGVVIQKVSF